MSDIAVKGRLIFNVLSYSFVKKKNRLPTVARVLSASGADSTRKFETLGSNFSQETHRGYWRPTLHQTKSNSFPLAGGTSARTFRLVQLIQHDSPVQ